MVQKLAYVEKFPSNVDSNKYKLYTYWTLDGNNTTPIASVNNIGEFEVSVSNGVCTGTAL